MACGTMTRVVALCAVRVARVCVCVCGFCVRYDMETYKRDMNVVDLDHNTVELAVNQPTPERLPEYAEDALRRELLE